MFKNEHRGNFKKGLRCDNPWEKKYEITTLRGVLPIVYYIANKQITGIM